jgi:hypothetical protein
MSFFPKDKPAESGTDYNLALAALVEQNQGKAVPFQAQVSSGASPKIANIPDSLLSVFQQSFPDMDFEVIEGGIRSKPKDKTAANIGASVPDGYSPKLADAGIRDYITALEKATTEEEKFSTAVRLNAAVQTQKAYRFGEFKGRAEAEYGIPDLMNAIERIKQAEAASPHNPGNGIPSKQRMDMMITLIGARTAAANRVKDFMDSDPSLSAAENLAKATITELEGKMRLEQRGELLDEKKRKRLERESLITSYEPNYVNNVQILKYGKLDPTRDLDVRNQLADGKIKLSETERMLATASDDTLTNLYSRSKDIKDKAMVLTLLEAKEEQITGDKAQAKRNIGFYKAVMDSDLGDQKNPFMTPAMRARWKQASSEATAQTALSSKSKDEAMSERSTALKREMLAEGVKAAFFGDVSTWQGLFKSDEVAQAILRGANDKKEKLTTTAFVDRYLAYNDGKPLEQKSKAIQAIMTSAAAAVGRSHVLPIPSEESIKMEAQRITAATMLRRSSIGSFIDNPFRN